MPVTIDGSNTPTAGGIAHGDGTEIAFSSAGTSGQPLLSAGSGTPTFGTLGTGAGGTGSTSTTYCNLTSNVTGTLPVANGGTGATSLTANNVLLGNGTSAVQAVAPGSSGNILTSNGTTWQSVAPAGGGAWELLSTINVSSGASSISALNLATGYAAYKIIGSASLQTANKVYLQVYDGPTNTNATDYSIMRMLSNSSSASILNDSTTSMNISGNFDMSIYYPFTFELDVITPTQRTDWLSGIGINNRVGIGIRTQGFDSGGSIRVSNVGWGACTYGADIDGVRLIVGAGYNWSAGKVWVYGLKDS